MHATFFVSLWKREKCANRFLEFSPSTWFRSGGSEERKVAVVEKERERERKRERGAVNSLVRVRPHLHDSYSIHAISPPVITIHVRISGGGMEGRTVNT